MIDIFKDIKTYHKALGYDYDEMLPNERMEHVRINALALYQEVAELVDSVPWKPWRKMKDQTMDKENATKEIIDCIFFLGAISEILFISPEELDRAFDDVIADNYDRIATGYNNKPEERR